MQTTPPAADPLPKGSMRIAQGLGWPPRSWLGHYDRADLPQDMIAGATLAAYAIPVALAYASLAGLPPHYGIYCYLAGCLGYVLLGSSRQLAIGPTSAIAMLVGSTIAGMGETDPVRWASIAALTALCVAVLCAVAWCLRLSGLVSFISETILVGFKAGAALTIAMTQLPKLFGTPGGGDHFLERVWILAGQLSQTNLTVLGLGLAALAILLLGERFLPGKPVALAVVAAAIVLMSLTALASVGVAIVGAIPAGLPALTWPEMRLRDIDGVIPLAAACFLLAYVEGISAARAMAEKHGYEIDPRQELLALGAANLGAALFQGFPIAGGLSQSAVNDKAGARTPLSLVFAALVIAGCLLFFTGLLHNLPTVILAAIVLVAVKGLINVPALLRLWRISRTEFAIALVALVGVLLLGVLKGVLLAVIVSLLMLLAGAAHPHVAFLGRIPGTSRFSDLDRHKGNESLPGVLIFRVEASVLYFNVDHVRNSVRQRIAASPPLGLVVCDLSNSPYVDVSGSEMLAKLHQELVGAGTQMRVVEAHGRVRELLRAIGLEEKIGQLNRHTSIEQALVEFGKGPHEASSKQPT